LTPSRLKNSYMKTGMNWRARGSWESKAVIILLALVVFWVVMYFITCHGGITFYTQSVDLRVEHLRDKIDAVNRLNKARAGTPLDLLELNTPKWRAEQVKAVVSSYDARGRHPLYWYTRLDGGLYAVEEVIVWRAYEYLPPETSSEALEKVSLREGVEMALSKRRESLLNPCYNYVDIEAATVVELKTAWRHRYKNIWKVYIIYLVGKWVNWTSLPTYSDGRFTAEGYADPVMRPVAFVVRYAPYERRPHLRETYSLGNVQFCRYLDPPADCKDANKLNGTFVVQKALDSGKWYVKIDASVPLNRTGLYTFELIAEDLRSRRRCSIMHHTVEVPKR
jgi:hypothetical protein